MPLKTLPQKFMWFQLSVCICDKKIIINIFQNKMHVHSNKCAFIKENCLLKVLSIFKFQREVNLKVRLS